MPAASRSLNISDFIFVGLAACYAWLAWFGIWDLSGHGLIIDSDLQTYVQGLAGEKNMGMFAADPVLHSVSPANGIPNLQRYLAGFLLTDSDFARAFLQASAIIVFLFHVCWYILGRLLMDSPALAALLAVCSGVTIWIGWGTFWGASHSDPVPRVFFAAVFPLLLGLAIAGYNRPALRLLTAFATGMCMWIHGVSALACGAMFCLAFLCIRPVNISPGAHLVNSLACCLLFLAPVMLFLWPSLVQKRHFSTQELEMFFEMFHFRWREDYSGFGQRLLAFLNPFRPEAVLFELGLASWFLVRKKGSLVLRRMCDMYPCFLLALALVTLLCYAEPRLAPWLGRLPMGHELVRGLRFLAPLSWIVIVAAAGMLLGRNGRRLLLAVMLVCIILFDAERQNQGMRHALAVLSGLPLPGEEVALSERDRAMQLASAIRAVGEYVPKGESIFDTEENMAIRYAALRPLAHAWKDGYVHFYNKDAEKSARWLQLEKLKAVNRDPVSMWLAADAQWLLTRNMDVKAEIEKHGRIVWSEDGWILARRQS